MNHNKNSNFRFDIAIPSIILIIVISTLLLAFPEHSSKVVNMIHVFTTSKLKSIYLLIGLFAVGFLGWIALSRYGNIKFGGANAEKEFKNLTWFSMLFCSGMGIGLCYWAFVEPIAYFGAPPFGLEPFSTEAGEYAMTYSFFHWGLTPWGLYGMSAIAIAYGIHNKKMKTLSMSSATTGLLGKRSYGNLGKIIDILVVVGLFGGLGTSLALGVPLVTSLVSEVFDIQLTLGLEITVVLGWTLIFTLTVFSGLEKGMSKLADMNTYLGIFLLLFIFFAGDMIETIDLFLNSLGLLSRDFIRMSLWTDPIAHTGFVENWTVFYWAWWGSLLPLMALFTARISRGRTIKEVSLGVLAVGSLGSFAFFTVWGGYAMDLQMSGELDVFSIYMSSGAPTAAIEVIKTLPFSEIILILFAVLAMIFVSTTVNTGAYTIASTCTKKLEAGAQPGKLNRTIWGLLYGFYATALFVVAGNNSNIEIVQLSSIITALPIMVLGILVCISGMNWLKEDYGTMFKYNDNITLPDDKVIKVKEY